MEVHSFIPQQTVSFPLGVQGFVAFGVRGIWMISRLGPQDDTRTAFHRARVLNEQTRLNLNPVTPHKLPGVDGHNLA